MGSLVDQRTRLTCPWLPSTTRYVVNPCGVFAGADMAFGKRGAGQSECVVTIGLGAAPTHLIAEHDGLLRIGKNGRCFGDRGSRYETGWFDRRTIHFLFGQRRPVALRIDSEFEGESRTTHSFRSSRRMIHRRDLI